MFKESDQIEKFEPKVWLSSPTMHGEEFEFLKEAYETNWMSTVGANINEVERLVCKKIGCKYAVGLSAGTAALHMAVKLAGVKPGEKVFCSDMTFSATVNPIVYEGGVPVFIDTEYDTWNMDPEALEKAFELYPDVKVVVIAHLYGTPGKVDELRDICEKHGAVIIEDAAESMGATYKGLQTGTFGKYNAISFNGNKIITGSSGGMLLTDDKEAAEKVRKWSTQSREAAPWYQHEEIGYNYRMSNVIAGVVRGQIPHLEEHIAQKKAIYDRYKEGFKDLPVQMNPYDSEKSEPTNREKIMKIIALHGGMRGFDIPGAIFVITGDLRLYQNEYERNTLFVDGGIFLMNLLYALDSLGLVACPLIWGSEPSDDKKLSEILNIKPHEKIVAWISAGYCPGKAFKAAISSKRDLNTILRIIE